MSQDRKVWVNGKLVPWENATVAHFIPRFQSWIAIFEVFLPYFPLLQARWRSAWI